jgi:hypothetical protein
MLWSAVFAVASGTQPHVALIVADDLGFGDLGYVGSDIKTPRIDALVRGGVVLSLLARRWYPLARRKR